MKKFNNLSIVSAFCWYQMHTNQLMWYRDIITVTWRTYESQTYSKGRTHSF